MTLEMGNQCVSVCVCVRVCECELHPTNTKVQSENSLAPYEILSTLTR